ncbi:MAG: hypothetical protein GYB65_11800 [Chloroflexi bacterium]|nr:hypothetical protein [Chloroflexota bacterium]
MTGPCLPPNVTPDMLSVGFWLDRAGDSADTPFITPETIPAFNDQVHASIDIPAVLDLPDTLSAARVREQIARYAPPAETHYGNAGQPLDDGYFAALQENASPHLPTPVRFGLAVCRTNVRAFPTHDLVTPQPYAFGFDRLQETTIDPGWSVAVLGSSSDGLWYFCLTPHYWGWVLAEHIALGTRQQVKAYTESESFVMTTAERGLVALATGSGLAPQMGTRLLLDIQVSESNSVLIPARLPDGSIKFRDGIIPPHSDDFYDGYLPCTPRTILQQAFRLLGSPYAWGGSRLGLYGRDCSRLVRDVYAVTGVNLPRNSGQQTQIGTDNVIFAPDTSDDTRRNTLTRVPPGAILAAPGHVMIYLGHVDGEPYALHASGAPENGRVIVSDLSLGKEGSLLQRLTHAIIIS